MSIRLPKVDERREAYKVTLAGAVIDDIALYCEAYQRQHRQTIDPPRLMASMVMAYMAADKEFQRFKRGLRPKPATPLTPTPTTRGKTTDG